MLLHYFELTLIRLFYHALLTLFLNQIKIKNILVSKELMMFKKKKKFYSYASHLHVHSSLMLANGHMTCS